MLDTWLSRSIDVAKEACVAINNLAANCVTNRDKFASLDVTRVLKSVVNHPTCRDTYAADAAKKAYKNFAKTIKS